MISLVVNIIQQCWRRPANIPNQIIMVQDQLRLFRILSNRN